MGPPAWGLGCQDTGWWSRYAPPHRQPWPADQPLRLRQHAPARHAAAPKAVAGEGRLRAEPQGMRLRLVDGRPVRAVTAQFLAWLTAGWAAEGPTALRLGWAKASWHVSQAVRAWLTAHNRRVQQEGGCRIVVCALPSQSPWVNRIAPKGSMASGPLPNRLGSWGWTHGSIGSVPMTTVSYSNLLHNKFRGLALAATVGTPVTRRPPCRPGRAVFPHPVPRLHSHPCRAEP